MGKKPERKDSSSAATKWLLFSLAGKLLIFYIAVNFVIQLVRKPTEIFSFAGFALHKTPGETWRSYGAYFVDSATENLSADFLAALAHTESAGNPWASPPWRIRLNAKPFEIYAPASTAVGLYQFLDETFHEVSTQCLSGAMDGTASGDVGKCEVYGLPMTRLSPQSSTQIAASYLNKEVLRIVREARLRNVTTERKQILAALIHLCGKRKAETFARTGFSWARLGQCGPHNPQRYVQQVLDLKRVFADLQGRSPSKSFAYGR